MQHYGTFLYKTQFKNVTSPPFTRKSNDTFPKDSPESKHLFSAT